MTQFHSASQPFPTSFCVSSTPRHVKVNCDRLPWLEALTCSLFVPICFPHSFFFWVNELAFSELFNGGSKVICGAGGLENKAVHAHLMHVKLEHGIDHRSTSMCLSYAGNIESTQNSNPVNRFVGILLLASFERLGNFSAYGNSFSEPISRVNREQKCL